MLGFMDYVQTAFHDATGWNTDNSYATLTATSQALLDFEIPRGLRLNVSALSAPNFATSYAIGTTGVVDGTLAYLYSSRPLLGGARTRSSEVDLRRVVRGYRHLPELRGPDEAWWWEVWQRGRRIDRRDTLLYGRVFLPRSSLEALYLRRLSPNRQLQISCVSDRGPSGGGGGGENGAGSGTVLALLQTDVGRYSAEYLYSTDGALLGARGLYNFGPDPQGASTSSSAPAVSSLSGGADIGMEELEGAAAAAATANEGRTPPSTPEPVHGRFSAGAEAYYGLLNKSGGCSGAIRFTTLPRHRGFPYTMTLTLNPLVGALSSTYAVAAGRGVALCSRFDFNVYSYESGVRLGCELWGGRGRTHRGRRGADAEGAAANDDDDDAPPGVLKARVDQNWNIGLLWEGRVKELLVTLGASLDLKRREQMVRAVGVEVQYSS